MSVFGAPSLSYDWINNVSHSRTLCGHGWATPKQHLNQVLYAHSMHSKWMDELLLLLQAPFHHSFIQSFNLVYLSKWLWFFFTFWVMLCLPIFPAFNSICQFIHKCTCNVVLFVYLMVCILSLFFYSVANADEGSALILLYIEIEYTENSEHADPY